MFYMKVLAIFAFAFVSAHGFSQNVDNPEAPTSEKDKDINDLKTIVWMATDAYYNHDFENAYHFFNQAIEFNNLLQSRYHESSPLYGVESFQIESPMIQCLLHLNRFDEYISHIDSFLKRSDIPYEMRTEILYHKASVPQRQGNMQEAIESFTAFEEAYPNSNFRDHAKALRLQCYYELGRFDELESEAKIFLESNPQCDEWKMGVLKFHLAMIDYQRGNAEATEKLTVFANEYPSHPVSVWAKFAAIQTMKWSGNEEKYLAALDEFVSTLDLNALSEELYQEIVCQWFLAPYLCHQLVKGEERFKTIGQYHLLPRRVFDIEYFRAVAKIYMSFKQDGLNETSYQYVIRWYPKYQNQFKQLVKPILEKIDEELAKGIEDTSAPYSLYILKAGFLLDIHELDGLSAMLEEQQAKVKPLSRGWAELTYWRGITAIEMKDYDQAEAHIKTLLNSSYEEGDLRNHIKSDAVNALLDIYRLQDNQVKYAEALAEVQKLPYGLKKSYLKGHYSEHMVPMKEDEAKSLAASQLAANLR